MDQLVQLIPVVQDLLDTYDGNTTLVLSDREKFIYSSDKLGMGIQVGDVLKEGSMTYRTVHENRPIRVTVDSTQSVFATDYTCACVPVVHEGEVIGAVSWGVNTNQFKLTNLAKDLGQVSTEVSNTTNEYAQHATNLSEIQKLLVEQLDILVQKVESIQRISQLIDEIASKTKILGFNASIEAARSGDAGAAFRVIAKEIRQLAEQSQHGTVEIQDSMAEVSQRVQEAFAACKQIANTSEQQAAGAEELLATFAELQSMVVKLGEMASYGI